jgi:hypothetical protein
MTRVCNVRENWDEYVYIGRGSKWGNPFKMLRDGSSRHGEHQRNDVILRYTDYLLTRDDLIDETSELEDCVLGCYCSPKKCHGDVLAFLANARGASLAQKQKLLREYRTRFVEELGRLDL